MKILAIFFAVLLSSMASARQGKIAAAYDVYTGGLQVMEFAVDLEVTDETYDIRARLKTRGIYATLFSWEQVNRVTGALAGAQSASPQRFEQRGRFRGQERRAEIDYRDGRVDRVAIHPDGSEDGDRERLGIDEVRDTLDPLSGIVMLMQRLEGGGDCAGTYDGYDGRRRFRIELTDAGQETVEAALVAGPPAAHTARVCDFVYRMTGGFARRVFWGPDRQREPRAGRIWLVVAKPGAPALPVRIEMDGTWGRMITQLREIGADR